MPSVSPTKVWGDEPGVYEVRCDLCPGYSEKFPAPGEAASLAKIAHIDAHKAAGTWPSDEEQYRLYEARR